LVDSADGLTTEETEDTEAQDGSIEQMV
jgi:hypothetical protein